ncbi:hypothetical protein QBC40DRAFT_18973 [Triangularia verruculosa]|uniref:Uncharacterized protein n=1 Tax=Triangularia verruculosa TaxID=2587418 RepID=A0AAN6X9S2_9PEZI|nr:hypothetical protein QBC40DRAFT_18973 [Triangularia verruculosa]
MLNSMSFVVMLSSMSARPRSGRGANQTVPRHRNPGKYGRNRQEGECVGLVLECIDTTLNADELLTRRIASLIKSAEVVAVLLFHGSMVVLECAQIDRDVVDLLLDIFLALSQAVEASVNLAYHLLLVIELVSNPLEEVLDSSQKSGLLHQFVAVLEAGGLIATPYLIDVLLISRDRCRSMMSPFSLEAHVLLCCLAVAIGHLLLIFADENEFCRLAHSWVAVTVGWQMGWCGGSVFVFV